MTARALLTILLGWLLLTAQPVLARPPVWIAHGRHASIFIFGSMHLLPSGVDWAPEPLLRALPGAREIWFELPIDATTDKAAERLMAAQGFLPSGDSLSAHLTADQNERLNRAAAQLGLDAAVLQSMRPWLAEVTLSLAVDAQEGASPGRGVERQIQDLTPPAVRRRAFETPEEQIGFLAGASLDDQIASLDATLHEIADDPGAFRRMLDGWMSGDVAELQADALDPLMKASPALYRRLISDRNARWADRLFQRLKGRGVVVVVVGMGHLIGPQGVPARLRAMGATVEGP